MKIGKIALTLTAGLIASTGLFAAPARADNYPSRTITMVVPFPPGGQAMWLRASSPKA